MQHLFASLLALSSAQPNECFDKEINTSAMSNGEVIQEKWMDAKVTIYKGDMSSNMPLSPLRKETVIPKWWPLEKMPVFLPNITNANSSHLYSVLWSPSPTNGCYVKYFPPIKTAKEPGRTPMFVGKKWDGGYIDFCNMLAFNKKGELVASDEAHIGKTKKLYTDMLSPPYLVLPNSNVKLKCSPNK